MATLLAAHLALVFMEPTAVGFAIQCALLLAYAATRSPGKLLIVASAAISLSAYYFGATAALIALLVWGYAAERPRLAVVAAILSILAGAFAQSLVAFSSQIHSPLSLSSLVTPLLACFVGVYARACMTHSHRSLAGIAVAHILLWSVLVSLAYGSAIGPSLISNDVFRSSLVAVSVLLSLEIERQFLPSLALGEQNPMTMRRRTFCYFAVFSVLCAVGAYGLIAGGALNSEADTVYFDESHGEWETTLASFGKDDFGRAHAYTYSELPALIGLSGKKTAVYSGGTLPPPATSILIVKMPTKPMTGEFGASLASWVSAGGRVLAIADHTDLYGSTQLLNDAFRSFTSLKVGSTATFDSKGRPNEVVSRTLDFLAGDIQSNSDSMQYMTGTTFATIPLSARTLATYGPSFSEPADYGTDTRFGTLVPNLRQPFSWHASTVVQPVGYGGIAIFGDSTIWSSFAVHRYEYKHHLLKLINILDKRPVWTVWNISLLALSVVALSLLIVPTNGAYLLAIALLCLNTGISAGLAQNLKNPVPDGSLEVVLGQSASLQVLPQLVPPGTNGYSRAASALVKHRLSPTTRSPGMGRVAFHDSLRWLAIEPDRTQLPSPAQLIHHLRTGASLTILFAGSQAKEKWVISWLGQLGLTMQARSGLAISEEYSGRLAERDAPQLMRDISTIALASPYSQLAQTSANPILQQFSIRPTAEPQAEGRGQLNVSFRAEQFSDQALGDVWEGVRPTTLGRIREAQLAQAIQGTLDWSWPASLQLGGAKGPIRFPHFQLLVNGTTYLKGKVTQPALNLQPKSLRDDPETYIAELQSLASEALEHSCPKEIAPENTCEVRTLGPDGIEWLAHRIHDGEEQIGMELLHERSFSSSGTTYNIVFAK